MKKISKRCNRYGLRKLTVGVASVLLGTILYGGLNSSTAHADQKEPDSAPPVSENEQSDEREAIQRNEVQLAAKPDQPEQEKAGQPLVGKSVQSGAPTPSPSSLAKPLKAEEIKQPKAKARSLGKEAGEGDKISDLVSQKISRMHAGELHAVRTVILNLPDQAEPTNIVQTDMIYITTDKEKVAQGTKYTVHVGAAYDYNQRDAWIKPFKTYEFVSGDQDRKIISGQDQYEAFKGLEAGDLPMEMPAIDSRRFALDGYTWKISSATPKGATLGSIDYNFGQHLQPETLVIDYQKGHPVENKLAINLWGDQTFEYGDRTWKEILKGNLWRYISLELQPKGTDPSDFPEYQLRAGDVAYAGNKTFGRVGTYELVLTKQGLDNIKRKFGNKYLYPALEETGAATLTVEQARLHFSLQGGAEKTFDGTSQMPATFFNAYALAADDGPTMSVYRPDGTRVEITLQPSDLAIEVNGHLVDASKAKDLSNVGSWQVEFSESAKHRFMKLADDLAPAQEAKNYGWGDWISTAYYRINPAQGRAKLSGQNYKFYDGQPVTTADINKHHQIMVHLTLPIYSQPKEPGDPVGLIKTIDYGNYVLQDGDYSWETAAGAAPTKKGSYRLKLNPAQILARLQAAFDKEAGTGQDGQSNVIISANGLAGEAIFKIIDQSDIPSGNQPQPTPPGDGDQPSDPGDHDQPSAQPKPDDSGQQPDQNQTDQPAESTNNDEETQPVIKQSEDRQPAKSRLHLSRPAQRQVWTGQKPAKHQAQRTLPQTGFKQRTAEAVGLLALGLGLLATGLVDRRKLH